MCDDKIYLCYKCPNELYKVYIEYDGNMNGKF